MTGELMVTPEILESTARNLEEVASKFKVNFERIFSEVDNLSATWKGEANEAYTLKIRALQNDFDGLYRLYNKYSEFLDTTGKNYRNQENILIEMARTELSTGR